MGGNALSVPIEHAQKTGVCSLKNKKLEKFPEELFSLKRNLRTLDLSDNKIDELPADVGVLQMLRTFKLDDNKLGNVISPRKASRHTTKGELPRTFGNLGKLEALHLSGNPLMTFPSPVLRCSNLKHLDLSRCRLSKLPEDICLLKKFHYLCLSSNRFETIPDSIGKLKVVELDLNHNSILVIPESLTENQSLRVLRLDENCITVEGVPPRLLSHSTISTLSLEGNPLDIRKFRDIEGYDQYMERYTATKRKCD